MSKSKLTINEQVAKYEQEIEKSLACWQYLLKYGANDPFWSDGVNMNLVRNHVIWYLTQIAELTRTTRQLSMFDIAIDPPVDVMDDPRIPRLVNDNYMATDRKLNVSDEENARLVRVP